MPMVLVAYSGGYYPAAYALKVGGVQTRIRGVVLLDALYGESDKFAAWVAVQHSRSFFVSAYSDSSRAGNEELKALLAGRHVRFKTVPPATFGKGDIVFLDAGADIEHVDFLSRAWTDDPLAWMLARVPGFPRRAR
jgi:hypothetical protein